MIVQPNPKKQHFRLWEIAFHDRLCWVHQEYKSVNDFWDIRCADWVFLSNFVGVLDEFMTKHHAHDEDASKVGQLYRTLVFRILGRSGSGYTTSPGLHSAAYAFANGCGRVRTESHYETQFGEELGGIIRFHFIAAVELFSVFAAQPVEGDFSLSRTDLNATEKTIATAAVRAWKQVSIKSSVKWKQWYDCKLVHWEPAHSPSEQQTVKMGDNLCFDLEALRAPAHLKELPTGVDLFPRVIQWTDGKNKTPSAECYVYLPARNITNPEGQARGCGVYVQCSVLDHFMNEECTLVTDRGSSFLTILVNQQKFQYGEANDRGLHRFLVYHAKSSGPTMECFYQIYMPDYKSVVGKMKGKPLRNFVNPDLVPVKKSGGIFGWLSGGNKGSVHPVAAPTRA
ncbi:hypothetical protein PRZ48_012648 [Zasmidium cellare]|uniref:Uncharacterized protein n=1 Tax=Zasmidium cellare TaxID=395010 RepID=A0ABR0E5G6_ZASCE|nr:hypothetical protein PRZ48_012648 [Zasmidium cellare]